MMILALDLGKSKSVGCIWDTIDNTHRFVATATTPKADPDAPIYI